MADENYEGGGSKEEEELEPSFVLLLAEQRAL